MTMELNSTLGLDYQPLQELLASEKWVDADYITSDLLFDLARQRKIENDKKLTISFIDNMPCVDLQTIDNLWRKYSNEHFGLSVQTLIFFSLNEDLDALSKAVGWEGKEGYIFYDKNINKLSIPKAYFPNAWPHIVSAVYRSFLVKRFYMRIKACGLC